MFIIGCHVQNNIDFIGCNKKINLPSLKKNLSNQKGFVSIVVTREIGRLNEMIWLKVKLKYIYVIKQCKLLYRQKMKSFFKCKTTFRL